jgi:hypothetical protein
MSEAEKGVEIMANRNLILDLSTNSNETNRVCEANQRLKTVLREHCPTGIGFILVVFESPLSLRRPQVALASDHDTATIERLFAGVLDHIQGNEKQ